MSKWPAKFLALCSILIVQAGAPWAAAAPLARVVEAVKVPSVQLANTPITELTAPLAVEPSVPLSMDGERAKTKRACAGIFARPMKRTIQRVVRSLQGIGLGNVVEANSGDPSSALNNFYQGAHSARSGVFVVPRKLAVNAARTVLVGASLLSPWAASIPQVRAQDAVPAAAVSEHAQNRDPERDHVIMNRQAAEHGSSYAYVNLARAYENGTGIEKDLRQSYQRYALGAVLGENQELTLSALERIERKMSAEDIRDARELFLRQARERGLFRRSSPLAAPNGVAPIFSVPIAEFIQTSQRQVKPKVYLAGPWGFPDFKHDNKDTYGHYVDQVKDVPFMQGAKMLELIARDIANINGDGYLTVNPWVNTLPPQLLEGPLLGVGVDLYGKRWSEGNLGAGTMSRESLKHWLAVLSKDYRLNPARYPIDEHSSTVELEEAFRRLVGDLVFRGDKHFARNSSIVFANLNSYRGDADDGTLWETIEAVKAGKEVVILVDENPPASLGEPIFGKDWHWNQMVNGFFQEHRGQVRIFHHIDDVLSYLKSR